MGTTRTKAMVNLTKTKKETRLRREKTFDLKIPAKNTIYLYKIK